MLDIEFAPELLIQKIELDYDVFISEVSTLLATGKIENRHGTALLALNGLLTQCFREVIKLFEPLKLVENQLLQTREQRAMSINR